MARATEGENLRGFSNIFSAISYMQEFQLGVLCHPDFPSQDSFMMISGDDVIYYAAEKSCMAKETVEVLNQHEINELFFSHPQGGWFYRDRTSFGELIGGVDFFDRLRGLGHCRIAA